MRISVRRIQETIAADFGIPLDQFLAPGRKRDPAWARHYAMLLARELTPLSLTAIGNLFQRDHSTVSTGMRRASERIASNRELARKLEARKLLLQSEPQRALVK